MVQTREPCGDQKKALVGQGQAKLECERNFATHIWADRVWGPPPALLMCLPIRSKEEPQGLRLNQSATPLDGRLLLRPNVTWA